MKREATADAIGTHERASATPAHFEVPAHALHGAAASWASRRLTLRSRQEWFAAIVTTPESEPAPVDDVSAPLLVTASATLSALERLEIYRRGYHARLIECLVDDYPVLQHALGEAAFEALCRAYIARHPSQGPNLNAFGRHLSRFCEPGFAADLAALEWAIVEVIHAPTAPTISVDDLAGVAPEQWPGARLAPNPSLRVLTLDYPVNAYLQAYRLDERPGIPGPTKSCVAVYRTGTSIWRMPLTPAMAMLVESLVAGHPLAAALERVVPMLGDMDEAQAANLVTIWFRDGVSSGLFSAVHVD